MTCLNPVYTIGDQIVEAVTLHQHVSTRAGVRDRRAGAARCRHRRPAPAAARVSAPDVRRHAAARHDRDGAVVPAQAADRRRADDRAGRHDPGADPRAAPQAPARDGHGDPADHARPRRRRGERRRRRRHVRQPGRRVRDGRGAVRPARSIRTPRACSARCRSSAPHAERLDTIPGTVPNPAQFPTGCKFHPRCPRTRAGRGEAAADADPTAVTDVVELTPAASGSTCCDAASTTSRRSARSSRGTGRRVIRSTSYDAAPVTMPKLDHRREVDRRRPSTAIACADRGTSQRRGDADEHVDHDHRPPRDSARRRRRAGRHAPAAPLRRGAQPRAPISRSSKGVLSRTVGHVKAVDGVSFDVAPGQDARPRRRVRLRQDDRRPDDPPPDPRHRRRRSATRARTSSPTAARSSAGSAGRCRSSSRTRSAA